MEQHVYCAFLKLWMFAEVLLLLQCVALLLIRLIYLLKIAQDFSQALDGDLEILSQVLLVDPCTLCKSV